MNNIGAMCDEFLSLSLYVLAEEHHLHELAQFLGDTAGLTDKFICNWMHHVIDGISNDENVSVFIKISHYRSPPLETASALAASAANVFESTALGSLGTTLSTDAARCTGSFTSMPSSS